MFGYVLSYYYLPCSCFALGLTLRNSRHHQSLLHLLYSSTSALQLFLAFMHFSGWRFVFILSYCMTLGNSVCHLFRNHLLMCKSAFYSFQILIFVGESSFSFCGFFFLFIFLVCASATPLSISNPLFNSCSWTCLQHWSTWASWECSCYLSVTGLFPTLPLHLPNWKLPNMELLGVSLIEGFMVHKFSCGIPLSESWQKIVEI